MQGAAAGGIEQDRQRLVEYLGGRKSDRIEIGEAPGEQVLPPAVTSPWFSTRSMRWMLASAIGDIA